MRSSVIRRAGAGLLSLAALSAVGGCVAVGGTVHKSQPTEGQQLIDLKRALDCGALDQCEYERLKRDIIESAKKQ